MDEVNVYREDEEEDNPEKVDESTDDWMASTEAHEFTDEDNTQTQSGEESFLQKNRSIILLFVIAIIIIASFAIIFL